MIANYVKAGLICLSALAMSSNSLACLEWRRWVPDSETAVIADQKGGSITYEAQHARSALTRCVTSGSFRLLFVNLKSAPCSSIPY